LNFKTHVQKINKKDSEPEIIWWWFFGRYVTYQWTV